MSSSPRRRHSPAVYRRRRLTVLVLVLLIGVGIWLVIAQPWRSDATAAAPGGTDAAAPLLPAVSTSPQPETPTPGRTDAASASGSAAPSPHPSTTAKACSTDAIEVTAVTDSSSYASGQDPKLSMTVANTGSEDCVLNVGTAAQTFTITSGSDTWWRSTDCQTEPSDMYVVLKAGQKVSSSQPLVWDRTRSSVATCQADDRPQAPGGGATYHLAVSIGGVDSDGEAMFQLY